MIGFRAALPGDLAAICRLGLEVNALHHDAMPDLYAPSTDPMHHRPVWEPLIAHADAETIVAMDDDGSLVGFVAMQVQDERSPLLQPVRHVRIASLAVTGPYRGRGIGRALMERAEAWARARGATDVRLGVAAFNVGAARLYEALGYTVRMRSMGKRLDD